MLNRRVSLFVTLLLVVIAARAQAAIVFGPKTYNVAAKQHAQFDETLAFHTACDTQRAVYTLVVAHGAARVKKTKISLNGVVVFEGKDGGTAEVPVGVPPSSALRIEMDGDSTAGLLTLSIRRGITTPAFAEKTYALITSKKERFTETFAVADPAGTFTLILRNGVGTMMPVDDARVELNGTEILSKKDIENRGNQNITQTILRRVSLLPQNTLAVELKANKTQSAVTLQIVRHLIDTEAPILQLDGIRDQQTVPSSPLALTGTVTDVSGLAAFTINGTTVPLGGAGEFRHTVALTAGPNVNTFVATDCEGNRREQRITINLGVPDTTPPVLELTYPPPGLDDFYGTTAGTRKTIIGGIVTDADSGVRDVTCNSSLAERNKDLFSCTVTLVTGTTQVEIVATDRAGNTARVQRGFRLNLDDTPPTVRAILPEPNASGWYLGPLTIGFECADNMSVTICPGELTFTDSSRRQVVKKAVDAAGNETSIALTLNIDGTSPSLTVDTAAVTITNEPQVRLTGEASDNASGIASVRCGGVEATFAIFDFECVVPLVAGRQTIEIVATDVAGNTQMLERSVELDQTPPLIDVEPPPVTTTVATITVSGSVADENGVAAFSIGGTAVALDGKRFFLDVPLAPGDNRIEIRAVDGVGNVATRTIDVRYAPRVTLTITSPADLDVLRGAAVTVTGIVSGPVASLRVNGLSAAINGAAFTAADVPLWQGRTVITAVATTPDGQITTASVTVYRDSIPPRVFVESPAAQSEVYASPIIVSGMVDDIVVGTINAREVQVTVNGTPAIISNRMFKAGGIALTPGENTLTVTAVDQGHNTTTITHRVRYTPPTTARIIAVSGNDQTATIGTELPQTIRVRVVDAANHPLAGRALTFTITQNDGRVSDGSTSGRRVSVTSDAQGEASVRWTLGLRAGAGNQKVRVTAAEVLPAEFIASGTTGGPALVVVDMGNNQFGVDGERLPRPIVVAVVDRGSNRVADVPVTFSVGGGGGSFDGGANIVLRTDSDGRAWTTPLLGPVSGFDRHVFRASVAGVESPAVFTASSAPAGPPAETKISGVVLDNSNVPIAGVTMRIEGTSIETRSDANGQFVFTGAPIGYVRLIADGSTALRPGTWPTLEFAMYTNSGQDNTIGMPIFLLPLDVTRGVQVDEQRGGTITLSELPGFSLTIAPGSTTFPGGLRTGTVSVTLVHNDKMPMVPSFGQQPRFLITIQPPGAHFDPPAELTIPNLDGLQPGEVIELYSFDHDLGQFVSIGTGSTSEDGTVVRSDAGVGIIKAGWHSGGLPTNPAGNGTTGTILVDLTVDEPEPPPAPPSTPAKSAPAASADSFAPKISANANTATDIATLVKSTVELTAIGSPTGSAPVGPASYLWNVGSGGAATYVARPACTNASQCVATLKSTVEGKNTARVTYTANNGVATNVANVTFVDLKIDITELSFEQDLAVLNDEPGAIRPVADPVWKKSEPTKIGAVAYVGNFTQKDATLQMKAVFKIEPVIKTLEDLVLVAMIEEDKQGHAAGFIEVDLLPIPESATPQTLTVTEFKKFKWKLPDSTYFFDPLKITWKVRKKNVLVTDPSTVDAGVTEIPLYVTLDHPAMGNSVYRTLLQLATEGTPQKTKEGAAMETWKKFGDGKGPKNVMGWDKRELVYYKDMFQFPQVEAGALSAFLRGDKPGGGRCGMFEELFVNALRVNHIDARGIEVVPDSLPTPCELVDVIGSFCADGLLIKNWEFEKKTLPIPMAEYAYEWKTVCRGSNDPTCVEMFPAPEPPNRYGDLVSHPGATGQNSPTPSQKAFVNHAIVLVMPKYSTTLYSRFPIITEPQDQESFTLRKGESRNKDLSFQVDAGDAAAGDLYVTVWVRQGTVTGNVSLNGTDVFTGNDFSKPRLAKGQDGRNLLIIRLTAMSDTAVVTVAVNGHKFDNSNPSKYFDPSYGREYKDAADFQKQSVAGYYLSPPFWRGLVGADKSSKAARPVDGSTSVLFRP